MTKEYIYYDTPIELPQYGLVVEGYWRVQADEGKVLVRRTDGKTIESGTLAVEFRDADGNPLEHPYIEKPEDYDEVDKPDPPVTTTDDESQDSSD